MSRVRFIQLVTELSSHAGLGPMACEVISRCEQAYVARDCVFPRPGSACLGAPNRIASEISAVGELDLRTILQHGARSSEELDLLTALMLLGTAANWPKDAPGRTELGRQLLWFETHSGLRCLSSAGIVLDGSKLGSLAESILQVLELPGVSPEEISVGRAWLLSADAPECKLPAERARVLAVRGAAGPGAIELSGDLGRRPRPVTVNLLLAMTTLLFFEGLARVAGRFTLGIRSPARLRLGEQGLELTFRRELLGRVLKERKHLVPLHEISQILREVRYPRLGLYVGFAALTLGTLIGARLFVDGLRVSGLSFSMMAWGTALVLLGLLLDLALTTLSDEPRGKCRLIVRTRRTGGFSVSALNPREVDSLLAELAARLGSR